MHAGEISYGFKKTCEILLAELHFYGIKETCKNWFTSHPTDKKQNVYIKSNETQNFSDWETTEHGILQGDILRPLLFIIHIHNLLT